MDSAILTAMNDCCALLHIGGLNNTDACAGIPVWISWLKYLSFVFYGYGQLVHIEFKDRQLYSCTDPNAAAGMCRHVLHFVQHMLCA